MSVNAINSQTTNRSTSTLSNSSIDKNAFLKILTAELANQDPLNSQDSTQYIAQLAQFSALEQMQNLNTSTTEMLLSQKFTQGAMLIGQNVEFFTTDSNGNSASVNEVVKSVKFGQGTVYLVTENNNMYNIDDMIGVGDESIDGGN